MIISPITKVDVAVRLCTLLLLALATMSAQLFVIPTFAAIYARDGLMLPLGVRLANAMMTFLFHPIAVLVLVAGAGYMLRKRWGGPEQRLTGVAVATLVFALLLIGQASVMVDLVLLKLKLV